MFYSIEMYAFPLTQRVPVEYNGTVYRIHTDGLHPGCVRLINEERGEELQHIHVRLERNGDDSVYHAIRRPAER